MREDANSPIESSDIVTRTVEFIPPDRRYVVLGELETIKIGDQHYLKKPHGSWAKNPSWVPQIEVGENIREAFHEAVTNGSLKIERTGTDTLDGQVADTFTISGRVPPETVVFRGALIVGNTRTAWVTKADGLLRKVESTDDAFKQWKSVVTYEYPPDIKIEAPIP